MAVSVGDLVAHLRLDDKEFRAGTRKLDISLAELSRKFAVFAAAAGTAVAVLDRMAARGSEVAGVQAAFARATGNTVQAIGQLERASGGLVSRYDLMVGLNRAVALGAAETAEQFGEVTRTAITLGRALGVDAKFAVESLTLGIGRQSRLILDNLGLIVSVEEANERYAASLGKTASELTEAEKKEAFRTAALESARRKIEELGGAQNLAGESATRMRVAFRNAIDELAAIVAQSSDVAGIFDGIAIAVESVSERIQTLIYWLKRGEAALLDWKAAAQGLVPGLGDTAAATRSRAERLRAEADAMLFGPQGGGGAGSSAGAGGGETGAGMGGSAPTIGAVDFRDMDPDLNARNVRRFEAAQRRQRAEQFNRIVFGSGRPFVFTSAATGGYQDTRGKFERAVDKFEGGVKSFGEGVKGVVKGAFSSEGLTQIGANLASGAIGFAADKAFSALQGLFDSSAEKLARALEQNTRALQAGGEFLAARLTGAGLADTARVIRVALENTRNRVATNDTIDGIPIRTFGKQGAELTFLDELKKAGLSWKDAVKVAETLGINLTGADLNDAIQSFYTQVTNATDGLDGLSGEITKTTDALRNVPEGFKIALATFNATTGVAAGSVAAQSASVVVNHYGDVNVDAQSKPVGQVYEEVMQEGTRRANRGWPSTLPNGMQRR